LKGEVTLVVGPGEDHEHKLAQDAKGEGFDIKKDSKVPADLLHMCKTLNSKVEMTEHELRSLMKDLFPDVPSYHINAVTRLAKQDGKESRLEGLLRRSGGIVF
jgi:hypothetical protein